MPAKTASSLPCLHRPGASCTINGRLHFPTSLPYFPARGHGLPAQAKRYSSTFPQSPQEVFRTSDGKSGSSLVTNTTMDTFRYTINDIADATGLSRKYIDRFWRRTDPLLEPHRRREEGKNKYWYDHGALDILHRVAELKRQGKTMPEIITDIKDELGGGERTSESTGEEEGSTPSEDREDREVSDPPRPAGADHTPTFLDAIRDAYGQAIEAKNEALQSKEDTIESLRQNILLLTDGRDPQQVKDEYEQKAQQAARQEQQIKELQQKNSALQSKRARKQKRRRRILDELKALEGKWFAHKKRTHLLAELEELDRKDAENI